MIDQEQGRDRRPTRPRSSYAAADNVALRQPEKSGYGSVQRAAAGRGATAPEDRAAAAETRRRWRPQRKIDVLTSERAKARGRSATAAWRSCARPSSTSATRRSPPPVDGTVGARSLRVGQYVQAGTQLMAVVPLDAVYVVANYKETQLTHVRPGQPVDDRGRHLPRRDAARAMSTACRRPAASSSRCCRPTTPPATSPRSCSASR